MENKEGTLYYVIPEGATDEEACSWDEIEAFCEAGRLSPNSLIYLPEKNTWEKASNTDLQTIFESRGELEAGLPEKEDEQTPDPEDLQAEYDTALQEIRRKPNNPKVFLNAATAAIDLGDRGAAVGFFQQAIELRPFDKKIANEIKRHLSFQERGQIRLLERPNAFWEDFQGVMTYPLVRGSLYFLVPSLALSLLALLPFMWPVVVALAYLWGYQTILETASGSSKPLHWKDYLSDMLTRYLKPALAGLLLFVEFCSPFVIAAQISILLDSGSNSNVFLFIQHSPVMVVLLWTAGVLYLPVALAILVSPQAGLKDCLNVRKVVKAIISMEHEYIAAVAFFFLVLLVWGGSRLLLGSVPVLGIVFPVLLGMYGMLSAGFVLGRTSARNRHLWTDAPVAVEDEGSTEFQ